MKCSLSWMVHQSIAKSRWQLRMKSTPLSYSDRHLFLQGHAFGLKNVWVTYQRPWLIFDDLIQVVNCYVDNMVVKSQAQHDHFEDLRAVSPSQVCLRGIIWKIPRFFTRFRKYNWKWTLSIVPSGCNLENSSASITHLRKYNWKWTLSSVPSGYHRENFLASNCFYSSQKI